jgi:hypothetical protein
LFVTYALAVVGLFAPTARTHPNEVLPVTFVAVTVYVACAAATVGVPDITPLIASTDNPAGSAGLTE